MLWIINYYSSVKLLFLCSVRRWCLRGYDLCIWSWLTCGSSLVYGWCIGVSITDLLPTYKAQSLVVFPVQLADIDTDLFKGLFEKATKFSIDFNESKSGYASLKKNNIAIVCLSSGSSISLYSWDFLNDFITFCFYVVFERFIFEGRLY